MSTETCLPIKLVFEPCASFSVVSFLDQISSIDAMSTAVPTMGTESGYAVDEQPSPIRATGFLSAFFGLTSGFCLLGRPLLFLPVLAILFGLIALRKCDFGVPVGTFAAKAGLFFAVLFGSAGLAYPLFAHRLVGAEAEQFARDFIGIVSRGDYQMGIELMNPVVERLPREMSLVDHYAPLRAAADPSAEFPNVVATYDAQSGIFDLVELGPDVEVYGTRRTRLYSRFGKPKVDTYWNNDVDPFRSDLVVTLSYEPNPRDETKREWFVDDVHFDEDNPVAETNY